MLRELHKAIYEGSPIDIFCVGTPNIMGDCIGPLIGSMLMLHDFKHDVQVIGTRGDPVVYSNYEAMKARIRHGAYVLVIDAVVGYPTGVWDIELGPIRPGVGVRRIMSSVGHAAIKCYTAESMLGLLSTSGSMVTIMAVDITTRLVDLLGGNKKSIYIE